MKSKILLAFICLFFLFIRFYKIAEIPPSVYWDEASIGYNAYSISQTGQDEWGDFLPLHFRAFGEFKLPVYIYSVAIFVKLFGLSEFSIRLPAVLFSLGTVLLVFVLMKKMFDQKVGLWSIFFLVISPWYFIFSRTGYEVSAGLMFYLLGIYLFLRNINGWYIFAGVISLILSMYSYNSFRILSPLTIALLIIFGKHNLKTVLKEGKIIILGCVVLLALAVVPIYRLFVYDVGSGRFQAVKSSPELIFSNYLSHFDPRFLFFAGDKNLRSLQSGFGQLYFPQMLLIPLGLIYLFKRSNYSFLFILLALIGPIPAAITKESPHALRAISLAPFVAMLTGLGVIQLNGYIKQKNIFVNLLIIIIFLIFFVIFFNKFITNYSSQSSKDWQYGYKRIFTDFKNQFNKYDQVVISDQYAQPYIFALFYLKYDPHKFRQEVVRNSIDRWGFSTVESFNKFLFTKVKLDNLPKGQSLIFATPAEKLSEVTGKGVILNLDNSIAFYIYEYEK